MTIRSTNIKRHRHTSFSLSSLGSVGGGTTFYEWLMRAQGRCLRTMSLRGTRLWVVQSISISRIFATLLFAGLAFKNVSPAFLSCLYAFAMVSDLIDGYVSRKLKAETYFGKVMDLVADKSLTTISLLYAAACGIDLLPIALIASRDVIMIGMRIVVVQGSQLLPTNRIFGGIMALLLWGNTLVLLSARTQSGLLQVANGIYWACAVIFTINLLARLHTSAPRIKMASMGSRLVETRATGNCRGCDCTCKQSTSSD